MRLAYKLNVQSILLAALALFSVSILIETAAAVEVSEESNSAILAEGQPLEADAAAVKPSKDCFILASRSFSIPFTVDQSGARPVEVRLYVSHGPADQWQMLTHKSPDVAVPQFEFTADADGEYWFATRTIDAEGNPHPSDDIQPQLKVYVDTTKPVVVLVADASAEGRIETSLSVDDATPIKELVLRYVTEKAKEWQNVDAAKLLSDGSLHFLPQQSWERISMQLIATDEAGNQTVVNRLLQRPRVAELPKNRYGATNTPTHQATVQISRSRQVDSQTVPDPIVQLDRNGNKQVQFQTDRTPAPIRTNGYAKGAPSSTFGGYRGANASPGPSRPRPSTPRFQPAANQTAKGNASDAPHFDLPAPIGEGVGLDGPQQLTETNQTIESVPAPRDTTAIPKQKVQTPKRPEPRTVEEAFRPLSEQSSVPKRELIPTPKPNKHRAARPAPPETVRAPIRHSDSERFSLEYELQAVGNLGVDAIELYGSTDDGDSWSLWGTDPDRTSPFDIETKEEGVFSFRIVVVGRNGLASPRPQRGETPDIVVVVDKAKPKTRITAAQYGEGNRIGALVIRYECIDPNLGPRPISLSFSDGTSGPWTTIAAGLRNDGDYVWPADPKLPRQIYLRLDCKDEAGNVGTYILEKPIDVQGLAPRARIRGFQSLSGMEAFPVDEQTAERPTAAYK
jgi:hypothetical protein